VTVLACGLIPALPVPMPAQEAVSKPMPVQRDGTASGESVPASLPSGIEAPAEGIGAPATPAAEPLPSWPQNSGGIIGILREDLSKPLSSKQKLRRAFKQAIFPGVVGSAAAAGFGMAVDTRADRDYGMGAEGFLDRWGSAFGQNAVGLFAGDFAIASMLHQDPRYHPDKRKRFGHRLGHALASVVVSQSDSGNSEFNSSHLLGILIATGTATAWHHTSDRTAGIFGKRFGYDVAASAIYHAVAEFVFYRKAPRR